MANYRYYGRERLGIIAQSCKKNSTICGRTYVYEDGSTDKCFRLLLLYVVRWRKPIGKERIHPVLCRVQTHLAIQPVRLRKQPVEKRTGSFYNSSGCVWKSVCGIPFSQRNSGTKKGLCFGTNLFLYVSCVTAGEQVCTLQSATIGVVFRQRAAPGK